MREAFWVLARSFRFAVAGIIHSLRTEQNLRIHTGAGLLAVALGFTLGISRAEWCAILLAIGLVWTAELLNTALERLGDAVTLEPQEQIRHAKDAAAGAVLAASIAAAAVGAVVFVPRLWSVVMP